MYNIDTQKLAKKLSKKVLVKLAELNLDSIEENKKKEKSDLLQKALTYGGGAVLSYNLLNWLGKKRIENMFGPIAAELPDYYLQQFARLQSYPSSGYIRVSVPTFRKLLLQSQPPEDMSLAELASNIKHPILSALFHPIQTLQSLFS